jgi:hypothetical protein
LPRKGRTVKWQGAYSEKENGKRPFAAIEIVAVASFLGKNPAEFMTPVEDPDYVPGRDQETQETVVEYDTDAAARTLLAEYERVYGPIREDMRDYTLAIFAPITREKGLTRERRLELEHQLYGAVARGVRATREQVVEAERETAAAQERLRQAQEEDRKWKEEQAQKDAAKATPKKQGRAKR